MRRLYARPAGRGAALAALLWLASGQAMAQNPPDGHFDWPLGDNYQTPPNDLCTPVDGARIVGCNLYIQQNYNNMDGPTITRTRQGVEEIIYTCARAHAGTDLQVDLGTSDGASVYAAADGKVLCTFTTGDYPGKVAVIRHTLPGESRPVYTMYGHLEQCTEGAEGCVADEAEVRRGQVIGTVRDQGGNSHLHFEVRTFPSWDYDDKAPSDNDPGDLVLCAGRGYAEEDGRGSPVADNGWPYELDAGYLNPIDFILSRRPPLPDRLTNLNLPVLERPNEGAPAINGSTALRPVAVVRDEDFQCETNTAADSSCATGTCLDLGHTQGTSNNRLTICESRIADDKEDCKDGACDWWYEVEATVPGSPVAVTGYVRIFGKIGYDARVHTGELYQAEGVRPWQEPAQDALVALPLRRQDLSGNRFQNQGSDPVHAGVLTGTASWVDFTPAPTIAIPALSLDGALGHVDIERTAGLSSSTAPFSFSVHLVRRSNDDEDVVLGQWHSTDPERQRWVVTFSPQSPDGIDHEGGELRFRVRTGPGDADIVTLRFVLPDCSYLGEWAKVGGSYDPADGIRLYWNDRQVARITAADLGTRRIAAATVPLRLGAYADTAGTNLTRFDGAFYDFQLWAEAPLPGAPADSVLIIDSSGSMLQNDRAGQRRHAARIFFEVSPPEDHVGVVDFDSIVQEATTSDTLLRLGDDGVIDQLSSLVYAIDSAGNTNIGRGLARSCQLLDNFDGHEVKAGILLTDGVGPWTAADRACYQKANYSLWAIGFGGASLTQLRSIVGSPDRAQVVSSAERALCELQQIRARLTGGDTIQCTQRTVYPGANVLITEVVPAGRSQMSFYTSWPGSDVVMTLTSPSGRVIGRGTVAPDVRHVVGPTFEVYTIETPEAGTWQINLYGADVRASGEPVTFGGSLLAPGDVRNLPPDTSAAVPSLDLLWPPNNKMQTIQILGVTDPEEGPVTIKITGITQDEPVSEPDRRHAPDGTGLATAAAALRAERNGGGNGRIYVIHFLATDDKGASTEGSVRVCVPHDQSGTSCVDDGQSYNSTVP